MDLLLDKCYQVPGKRETGLLLTFLGDTKGSRDEGSAINNNIIGKKKSKKKIKNSVKVSKFNSPSNELIFAGSKVSSTKERRDSGSYIKAVKVQESEGVICHPPVFLESAEEDVSPPPPLPLSSPPPLPLSSPPPLTPPPRKSRPRKYRPRQSPPRQSPPRQSPLTSPPPPIPPQPAPPPPPPPPTAAAPQPQAPNILAALEAVFRGQFKSLSRVEAQPDEEEQTEQTVQIEETEETEPKLREPKKLREQEPPSSMQAMQLELLGKLKSKGLLKPESPPPARSEPRSEQSPRQSPPTSPIQPTQRPFQPPTQAPPKIDVTSLMQSKLFLRRQEI